MAQWVICEEKRRKLKQLEMATPAKIAWIVVLVSVIVMVWLKQRSLHLEDEFHQWLLQNNLVDIENTLRNAGVCCISNLTRSIT